MMLGGWGGGEPGSDFKERGRKGVEKRKNEAIDWRNVGRNIGGTKNGDTEDGGLLVKCLK